MDEARHRIVANPFYVLELDADASRAEVERAGQMLLGLLELGVKSAAWYHTPLGRSERTPQRVREAMAALRDPEMRLQAELWARLPRRTEADEEPAAAAGWPGAIAALGWAPGE